MLQIPAIIYFSQSCMQMMSRIAYQLHSIVVTSPALSLQVSHPPLTGVPSHLHLSPTDSELLTANPTSARAD